MLNLGWEFRFLFERTYGKYLNGVLMALSVFQGTIVVDVASFLVHLLKKEKNYDRYFRLVQRAH